MDRWIASMRGYLGKWPEAAAPYFEEAWGLKAAFAVRAALLYAALALAGLGPRITSGFRDPRKQAAMRAAWDAGQREGLRVRPADPKTSYHTREERGRPAARAIDMPCRDDELGARIARALGLRAGYFFSVSDPGHYDDGTV